MITIPNKGKIEKLEMGLEEEYDLPSRLSRYQSTAPELLELAASEGLTDDTIASHALFVSDFIVTSSEVPMEVDDEARRKSIIAAYIQGMKERTIEPKSITKLFYIAYNLAVQLRRNDSFMAGRGIPPKTRAMISVYTYLIPYLDHVQRMMGEGSCNFELGIISAALANQPPDQEIRQFPELNFKDNPLLHNIFSVVRDFVVAHNQETNDNVVLPNISDSRILYVNTLDDFPLVSTYNCAAASDRHSLKAIRKMFDFFKNADRQNNKLVFLRGRIHNTTSNLILVRDPDTKGNPFIVMQTPIEEINVSEMLMLLSLHDQIGTGWTEMVDTRPIEETYFDEKTVTEEKWVEEEVEVAQPSRENQEQASKPGLFGRIKRMLFGSGDDNNSGRKDQKTEPKGIKRRIKELVTKKEEKYNLLGLQLPDFVSRSLGILSLADLRLFEEFDTIRESEYTIFGALESDFENNKTTFLTLQEMEDPEVIASTLDGLDHVIEKVVSHYFGSDLQLLPTEIVFLSDGGRRYIICMDGNDQRLVGTLAKTHVKDIETWQEEDRPDTLQRRSLHMRTGQLLSARQHTPLDRSIERIYSVVSAEEQKTVKLDYAILPYSRGRIDKIITE